jgi:hypothetical protein
MKCAHDQYRSVQACYDRGRGMLVYLWRCDRCGAHLGVHERVQYRPRYQTSSATALGRESQALNG